MTNSRRAIAALLICTPVVGCGGGGSSNASPPTAAVSPSPSPPVAPTPTPPPALPTPAATLTELSTDQFFDIVPAAVISGFVGSSPEAPSSSVLVPRTLNVTSELRPEDPNVSLTYTAATKSYALRSLGNTAVFSPQDLIGQNQTGLGFQKSDRDGTMIFSRIVSSQIPLTFVNIAEWSTISATSRETDSAGRPVDGSNQKVQYFTFGYPTFDTDMPRAGAFTYQIVLSSKLLDPSYSRSAFGTGTLQVDFATGQISSSTTLTVSGTIGGPPNITVLIAGAIAPGTNKWAGTLTSSDPAIRGTLAGRFYGPTAADIGGSFSASGPVAFAGALAGKQ